MVPEHGARSARWQSFARWTEDFPRLSDDPPATLELWKRILVYGVAFGTADRMIASGRIPAPVTEAATTASHWSTYAFAGAIAHSTFDGTRSAPASPPRSRRRRRAARAAAAGSRAAAAGASRAAAAGARGSADARLGEATDRVDASGPRNRGPRRIARRNPFSTQPHLLTRRNYPGGVSARRRNRLAIGAIAALAVAWALLMHAMGWGQLASYAQVRALADGRAEIDRWHWETKDKAWIDGHFYSVKAPGLAALTLPAYLGLDARRRQGSPRDAAKNVRRTDAAALDARFAEPPYAEHGYSEARASARQRRASRSATPIVWALTLFGARAPGGRAAAARARAGRPHRARLRHRRRGDARAGDDRDDLRVRVLPARRSRRRSASRPSRSCCASAAARRACRSSALAGLLAGLAVTFEYPLGLVGVILFVYALARSAPRLPRAAVYAARRRARRAPCSPSTCGRSASRSSSPTPTPSRSRALNGHAVARPQRRRLLRDLGAASPGAAVDLLFAGRGLLTLTPVLALGARGRRSRCAAATTAPRRT